MSNTANHIAVLLREVVDPRPPARLTKDGFSLQDRGLRRIVNPADICALEQALKFSDAQQAEVTVVCIGPPRVEDMLRLATSMGATRAIRVWDSALADGDNIADARLLQRVIEILKPTFFFSGNRRLDQGADPVPALASSRCGLPYVTSALSLATVDGEVEVLRKCDRGARQLVGVETPCALLFEDTSCEPRYPHKDTLLDALEAPIEHWGVAELGLPYAELGGSAARLIRDRCSFPRSNPQRVDTPDAGLPAFDRILALLSGGIKPREGKLNELTAEETADRLVGIFRAEGLLGEGEG